MKPKHIKIFEKDKLQLIWQDESTSVVTLKYLRDECPCASCKGETILFKTYRPPQPAIFSPEMYKIKSIQIVGAYAIQVVWKDGHNTGIYSWEYLTTLIDNNDNGSKQNYNKLL